MVTNAQVRDLLYLVKDKKNYIADEGTKAVLRNYTECYDYNLKDSLIEAIWTYLKSKIFQLTDLGSNGNSISIMHNNAGTGRILEKAPKNTILTAYLEDWYCKRISDILNQSANIENRYTSKVFDISTYFINGDNRGNRKYDIIFNSASENHTDYKFIDDTELNYLSPIEYYSVRSLDFLTKGGYLCILATKKEFDLILRNNTIKNKTYKVDVISVGGVDDYSCLILKRK